MTTSKSVDTNDWYDSFLIQQDTKGRGSNKNDHTKVEFNVDGVNRLKKLAETNLYNKDNFFAPERKKRLDETDYWGPPMAALNLYKRYPALLYRVVPETVILDYFFFLFKDVRLRYVKAQFRINPDSKNKGENFDFIGVDNDFSEDWFTSLSEEVNIREPPEPPADSISVLLSQLPGKTPRQFVIRFIDLTSLSELAFCLKKMVDEKYPESRDVCKGALDALTNYVDAFFSRCGLVVDARRVFGKFDIRSELCQDKDKRDTLNDFIEKLYRETPYIKNNVEGKSDVRVEVAIPLSLFKQPDTVLLAYVRDADAKGKKRRTDDVPFGYATLYAWKFCLLGYYYWNSKKNEWGFVKTRYVMWLSSHPSCLTKAYDKYADETVMRTHYPSVFEFVVSYPIVDLGGEKRGIGPPSITYNAPELQRRGLGYVTDDGNRNINIKLGKKAFSCGGFGAEVGNEFRNSLNWISSPGNFGNMMRVANLRPGPVITVNQRDVVAPAYRVRFLTLLFLHFMVNRLSNNYAREPYEGSASMTAMGYVTSVSSETEQKLRQEITQGRLDPKIRLAPFGVDKNVPSVKKVVGTTDLATAEENIVGKNGFIHIIDYTKLNKQDATPPYMDSFLNHDGIKLTNFESLPPGKYPFVVRTVEPEPEGEPELEGEFSYVANFLMPHLKRAANYPNDDDISLVNRIKHAGMINYPGLNLAAVKTEAYGSTLTFYNAGHDMRKLMYREYTRYHKDNGLVY